MKMQIAPLNITLLKNDPKSIIDNPAWIFWFQSLVDRLNNIPVHANNTAAVNAGLGPGDFYRTGANPDYIAVVH